MKYYTWYTARDVYGPEPELYYIYNTPIRDPTDEAEFGLFLGIFEEYKDDKDAFDNLEYSFNNVNLDNLDKSYKELKDAKIKNSLWQQVLKKRRGMIEFLFTSTL